ncbi:HEAT repeat protein [Streptomyces sp. 846.5]|nr:DUF4365 domain-containing protein [Streptomyces sp. 846.5]TDT97294.1 HEAT repeat protein [Streptomyces sp. 846.5]
MRADRTAATGSSGATEVKATLEKLGQGPIEVAREHDLGIDLLVQVRDDRRFDAGLLIGVQVKTSPDSTIGSYFTSPETDEDGTVTGWWHREADSAHFDSWILHQLPVILVLHDLKTRTSYWAAVASERVISTGKGFKLFVPADQTLDADHLPELLTFAASKRDPITWEGSAWLRDGTAIAPGDRLRHALLVPRLVAPHPGARFDQEIGPEEALALLAQGRFASLASFAQQHSKVPSLEAAAAHKNWKWRLVHAFGDLLLTGSPAAVAALITTAPGAAERVAATVIYVCALIEDEEYEQALTLLTAEVERDNAGPVDHAWMLVQRARLYEEADQDQAAGTDVVNARVSVLLAPMDPTTSAVAAAAAEAAFRASRWRSGAVEEFVTATDTVSSWWRLQNVSSAYELAAERLFDHWADRRTLYLVPGHPAYNELEAARWTANLAAHDGAWRATTALLGKQVLLDSEQGSTAQGPQQADQIFNALSLLRISGDTAALAAALGRLRSLGPVTVLSRLVESVKPGPWPMRTFRPHLELWELAGDLLPTGDADAAAAHCLALLDGSAPKPASTSHYLDVAHYVLRALTGLLPAAGPGVHDQVRNLLIENSPWTSPGATNPISRLALLVHDAALQDPTVRQWWRDAALLHSDPALETLQMLMLGRIAGADSQAAQHLLDRAADGSFPAIVALGAGGLSSKAPAVIGHLAREVRDLMDGFDDGRWPLRGRDHASVLAELNMALPEHARWDELVELLRHPKAFGDHTRRAYFFLAQHAGVLPADVRDTLAADLRPALDALISDEASSFGHTEAGGARIWLAVALGLLTADQQAVYRARLLTGSQTERMDAATLAGLLYRAEDTPSMIALLADPDAGVRRAAARGLATRASQQPADVDAVAGLQRAVESDASVDVPLAIAVAIGGVPAQRDDLESVLTVLRAHPSAQVRDAAAQAQSAADE